MRLITQSKFIMKLGYQRKLENALQYCPDELSEKLHYLTTLRATVSEFALALAGDFEIVKTENCSIYRETKGETSFDAAV